MAQYVIQIQESANGLGVGWLAKCFEVGEDKPIPTEIPSNRVQVIMTNTTNFNEIVSVYEDYTTTAIFSYNEGAGTISCTGAYEDTWDID